MYLCFMSGPIIPESAERLRPRLALVGAAPAERSGVALCLCERAEEYAATDAQIGDRIRLRRTSLGISQQRLATKLGISDRRVQEYERGTARITAVLLRELGQALDVPVSYFFDDTPRQPETLAAPSGDLALMRRQTLELVRSFYAVPAAARDQLLEFVKSIARAAAPS